MTMPIWMALPPEVHSALISSGPGPGPLLAAATAWSELSSEYATTAEELTTLLDAVRASSWEGPTAEFYAAAHVPYLAWLTQVSANSAATAAQHEAAATAYTAALAAMPTLPELATNHVVHGVLVATNFFGINTIPITLNELDYTRMWVQAAATMTAYQAASGAALASVPTVEPAPQILKTSVAQSDSDDPFPDPTRDTWLDKFIAYILKQFGIIWDPAKGTVNGLPYDAYTNAGQPIFWLVRSLELLEDFQQFGYYLVHNPILAFEYLLNLALFDWPTHIAEIVSWLATQPELLAPALVVGVAPLGAASGFAGLAGVGGHPAPMPAPAPAPVAPAPNVLTAATAPAAAPATAPASAPASSPAPTAPSTASPAAPAPPPAAGAGFTPPFLVGPPGIGFGSGASASASSKSQRKAPESDSAAAAAAAAAREQSRARRRRRSKQRQHDDEFMDMNVDVDPEWTAPSGPQATASERGAGAIGFAGARPKESVAVAGLTTLSDEFDGGPQMPMMPSTWEHGDAKQRQERSQNRGQDDN